MGSVDQINFARSILVVQRMDKMLQWDPQWIFVTSPWDALDNGDYSQLTTPMHDLEKNCETQQIKFFNAWDSLDENNKTKQDRREIKINISHKWGWLN